MFVEETSLIMTFLCHASQSPVSCTCLVLLTLAFISQISVWILSPCNVIVSKDILTLQNNLNHIPSFIFLKRFYIICLFFKYLEESTNGSPKLVKYSLGMGLTFISLLRMSVLMLQCYLFLHRDWQCIFLLTLLGNFWFQQSL